MAGQQNAIAEPSMRRNDGLIEIKEVRLARPTALAFKPPSPVGLPATQSNLWSDAASAGPAAAICSAPATAARHLRLMKRQQAARS